MRLLLKSTLKKIKKSIERFLSIMLIIALGISIFIGLRESNVEMLFTADYYYDKNNLMDFKVTSTYGLNDEDIIALQELKNVQEVVPSYSVDVISNGESIRVHAIEQNMNNVTLVNGKMPKSNNECVADYSKYKIGDMISFTKNNKTDILLIQECKVTGTVKSVLYIRDEKGISTVGNGRLSSFIFTKREVFKSDYYTEAYLIAKNSKSEQSYSNNYTKTIKPLGEELKTLKPIRETVRYEEILKDAQDQITNINDELSNPKAKTDENKLNELEKPVWYILDRTDNSGYISYKEDIIKVNAIAKILPFFFVVIVILMILNTLTRLIEEERTEIGILQSNGFGKIHIILSYLAYVCSSGLIGVGVGLIIGYSLIPPIVYSSFLARYYVPELITIVNPILVLLVVIITLLIMVIVTVAACMRELKEVPASLLRPKAPKSGKKVLLERISFIWMKLNFLWKTTVRNIFRYKKRIIMTVLGVAGCTALLVTGMGLNDSIDNISKLQYKNIIKYDAMYVLQENTKTLSDQLSKLFIESGINNPLLINQNTFKFSFDHKTEDVYVVIPSDLEKFNNYVNLKSIVSHKNIRINDDGAIITKQMAQHLNIKIGDNITIKNSSNELFYLNVSDIVENYVSHYIYISENYYKKKFNNDVSYNAILTDEKIEKNIKLNDYGILMVNNTSDIISNFNSFVKGLNKIIIMIIVFACFLAFIVLYNLTIINVSERKKEIATFKVLGFYDSEISSFVYRETLILTFLGIGLGLIIGKYLHAFVMSTAETDNIKFLRQINLSSYFLSVVLTILFSVLVQVIINKSLQKIDMIDSLKSTE